MKRTSLKSLILLNWKGLFYHRFDLHERVTALEGQNGAGKTTVMIAAYVALLPDLTKLRFTNVSEANQYVRRTYRKGWEVEGLS